MAEGERRIDLFSGGEDGYGYAVAVPGLKTYHWSINMDHDSAGKVLPATAPWFIKGVFAQNPITAAFEWKHTDGNPAVFLASGNGSAKARILRFFDDAYANIDEQAIDPYTGAVVYRYDQDGGVDADEEMTFFCNGSGNDFLVRMKSDGTIDQGATDAHDIKADGLFRVGSDLWLTQGYKLSKCTLNADPGKDASYATKIPCGVPTYSINVVINMGGSPIVLKGEGVFIYNPAPAVAEFELVVPASAPHPDNGKGGFTDGRGRVYFPTVDGDITVVTFGYSSQQKPTKVTTINRDTPWGRITALAADMEHVYAAVKPGMMRTQAGVGLVVKSKDGAAFTTHTTEVTDGKYSTEADLELLTSGDHIYIGADEPLMGVYLEFSSRRTPEVSGGSETDVYYSTGTSSFVEASRPHDSTMTFSQDGLIVVQDSDGADLTAKSSNPWAKGTVDSVSKYWIRLSPQNLLTGVKIRAVHVVPYRPPIDADTFPISAYALTGCLPKILVGTWQGEEIVWQDQWTLDSAEVQQMVVSRAGYSNSAGPRSLHCFSLDGVYSIPIGADAHPVRRLWPRLADYGDGGASEWSFDEHLEALSAWDFGQTAEVDYLVIEGEFLQSDDEVWVYHKWDNADRWERDGPYAKLPLKYQVSGKGSVLSVIFAFKDGSRDAVAPFFDKVYIPANGPGNGWRTLEDDSRPRGQDIESPATI